MGEIIGFYTDDEKRKRPITAPTGKTVSKIPITPAPPKINVTEEEFLAYEKIRQSGVTNMFDVNTVQDLTGLSREKILEIMGNYHILYAMYVEGKSWEEIMREKIRVEEEERRAQEARKAEEERRRQERLRQEEEARRKIRERHEQALTLAKDKIINELKTTLRPWLEDLGLKVEDIRVYTNPHDFIMSVPGLIRVYTNPHDFIMSVPGLRAELRAEIRNYAGEDNLRIVVSRGYGADKRVMEKRIPLSKLSTRLDEVVKETSDRLVTAWQIDKVEKEAKAKSKAYHTQLVEKYRVKTPYISSVDKGGFVGDLPTFGGVRVSAERLGLGNYKVTVADLKPEKLEKLLKLLSEGEK